jgi:hypothetical protein
MPEMHDLPPMKLVLRVLLALGLLAPIEVGAQSGDLAYCNKLYDLAVRYSGKAVMGDSKPTTEMIVAQDQCKHGNTAEGIATLEDKLRRTQVNLPPRQ